MKLKYVAELEGLRGLMALWVVVGHWATSIEVSFAPLNQKLYNAFAVDVFIMLSGFVICFLMNNKPESYGAYITRRFFRLFPAYVLVVIVSALLLDYSRAAFASTDLGYMADRRVEIIDNTRLYFWPQLLAHLTLFQGLVPAKWLPDTAYAFVGQAWSISVEWQFYLIAPWFLGWLLTPGKTRSQLGLAAIVVFCIAYKFIAGAAFIGPYLYLFAIGAGSFFIWKTVVDSHWNTIANLRGALAVLLPLLTLGGRGWVPIVIWVGTLYLALAARIEGAAFERRLAGIFTWSPVQFLGRISYCVYLSHMIVIAVGLHVVGDLNLGTRLHALVLLVFVVAGTILVSLPLHHLVEKPGIELGKRLVARRSATLKSRMKPSLPWQR